MHGNVYRIRCGAAGRIPCREYSGVCPGGCEYIFAGHGNQRALNVILCKDFTAVLCDGDVIGGIILAVIPRQIDCAADSDIGRAFGNGEHRRFGLVVGGGKMTALRLVRRGGLPPFPIGFDQNTIVVGRIRFQVGNRRVQTFHVFRTVPCFLGECLALNLRTQTEIVGVGGKVFADNL